MRITGGNDPTYDIELWETGGGGSPLATLVSGATLSSDTGVVVSATWDASLLAAADGSAVEVRVVGHRSGGSPNSRRTVEVGAIEWNANFQGTPSSELYYLRARYYDPETGRFLGRDPMRAGHLYVYGSNNPALMVDPSGLCPFWDCPFIDDEVDAATGKLIDTGECLLNKLDCVDPRQLLNPLIGLLPKATAFKIGPYSISYQLLATCLLQYPEACAAAVNAFPRAQEISRTLYGPDRPEGTRLNPKEGDAFQHCYWSGLITLDVGAGRADRVTTAYEATGTDNPTLERQFDLDNNERGRQIAQYLSFAPRPAAEAALIASCRSHAASLIQ